MAMLKSMQFPVVRETMAPEAIQFHALRRRHGGLYGSRTHGNS